MAGTYDTPKKQTYVPVESDNGGGAGLFGTGARREMYLDAGSTSSKVDETPLTKSEYIAQLAQKGREKLLENKEVVSFEGTVDVESQNGNDLSMGDIVQLVNEYGIELSARVIEIIYSHDSEGESVYPTFQNLPLIINAPPQIVVTGPFSGSTVVAISDGNIVNGVKDGEDQWIINIPSYGEWTVVATLGSESESTVVTVTSSKKYEVSLIFLRIYGVVWTRGSSTHLTRTDSAQAFDSPSPNIGISGGSSPFDNLYPWKGMVKETRNGNVMVKIPKFWFKWTKVGSSLQLQIANKYTEGFQVSPAHANREDGAGERDYVYIGRYHCNSSYVSTTGGYPVTSITREQARINIHNTGANIWQMDYAMWQTIQMLYLVEFANWNCQATIGYGCSTASSVQTLGNTDIMQYHTGTVRSNRTDYGIGTQYRWIEGLWENVHNWLDGCYNNINGFNVIRNPNLFSDAINGVTLGVPSSGYPTEITPSLTVGFEWATYPTLVGGSNDTYIPDYWGFSSLNSCLIVGGAFLASQDYGLFYTNNVSSAHFGENIGCRIQELP